ncbi:MAG: hypothetical protein Q4G59_03175 [Planctomycetia bacterium]|nr:hypothetical protein [Planctomycetia bacterium]
MLRTSKVFLQCGQVNIDRGALSIGSIELLKTGKGDNVGDSGGDALRKNRKSKVMRAPIVEMMDTLLKNAIQLIGFRSSVKAEPPVGRAVAKR